jgi:hypothetical protein
MNTFYELNVTFRIREPFITSTGTDAVRGLDQVFARDLQDNFMMHGSHVKGKFREALENLLAVGLIPQKEMIDDYLGREQSKNSPPKRGKLHFKDFRLKTPEPQSGRLTRIKIDSQTGTAQENALVTIEHLYKPRSLSTWTGTIAFFAESHEAAAIQKTVLQGFKWITNFGAMKGNGYGRLEEVEVQLQKDERKPVIHLPKNRTHVLTLQFEFHDPLFIGGIERGTNFKASQEVIPGAVLKGAFARFLNELCGVYADDDITAQNASVNQEFSELTKHFSRLRFSYAFPAHATTQRRPVTIPFSTVQDAKGNAWDLALDVVNVQSCADANDTRLLRFNDEEQILQEKAPAYQIDWKDSSAIRAHFGWAVCQTINTTRTAIEDESRTAEEEKLYTFQYISPYDSEGRKILWFATLQLPAPQEIGNEEFEKLYVNLQKAFDQGWQYLGKRDARFTLSVLPGDVEEHASRPFGLLVDDLAIVTLQTDTLLFDRCSIVEQKEGQQVPDLESLYTAYWQEVTGNTCELVDFFARQKMWGGYLVKQYTPADPYYPYILTEAGSVFVLRAKEQERDTARKKLQELERNGLPHPEDIKREQTDTLWKHCPFVPENGYGEICINLAWHWEKAYDNK